LPQLSSRCLRSTTCLYTVTPDFGFVVDTLPGTSNVLIASPCSGHGFKHSPAIGEALAQWATGRAKPDALAPFAIDRF
jgi:sarcosine oxidase